MAKLRIKLKINVPNLIFGLMFAVSIYLLLSVMLPLRIVNSTTNKLRNVGEICYTFKLKLLHTGESKAEKLEIANIYINTWNDQAKEAEWLEKYLEDHSGISDPQVSTRLAEAYLQNIYGDIKLVEEDKVNEIDSYVFNNVPYKPKRLPSVDVNKALNLLNYAVLKSDIKAKYELGLFYLYIGENQKAYKWFNDFISGPTNGSRVFVKSVSGEVVTYQTKELTNANTYVQGLTGEINSALVVGDFYKNLVQVNTDETLKRRYEIASDWYLLLLSKYPNEGRAEIGLAKINLEMLRKMSVGSTELGSHKKRKESIYCKNANYYLNKAKEKNMLGVSELFQELIKLTD